MMAFNVIKQIPPKSGNFYHYRQTSVRCGKTVHSLMTYVGKVNGGKSSPPTDSPAFALAELKLELQAQQLIHQARTQAELVFTDPPGPKLPLHHSAVSLVANSRSGSVLSLIQSALPPAYGYRRTRCSRCHGTGNLSPTKDKPQIIPHCSKCAGFGFTDSPKRRIPDFPTGRSFPCIRCEGKGLRSGRPCSYCKGQGNLSGREFPVPDFSSRVYSITGPPAPQNPSARLFFDRLRRQHDPVFSHPPTSAVVTTTPKTQSGPVSQQTGRSDATADPRSEGAGNPVNRMQWTGHLKINLKLKKYPIDESRLRKNSVAFQHRASLKGVDITLVPPIRLSYNPITGLKKRCLFGRHTAYTVHVNRQRKPFEVHFNHCRAQAHVFLDAMKDQQPDRYRLFTTTYDTNFQLWKRQLARHLLTGSDRRKRFKGIACVHFGNFGALKRNMPNPLKFGIMDKAGKYHNRPGFADDLAITYAEMQAYGKAFQDNLNTQLRRSYAAIRATEKDLAKVPVTGIHRLNVFHRVLRTGYLREDRRAKAWNASLTHVQAKADLIRQYLP